MSYVKVLLRSAGITFGHTASNLSAVPERASKTPCQQAPSAAPGIAARLVGTGKYDPAASKSSGVLPVYFSKREGSDLMIFIDGVKLKLLCWQWELKQNLFCWPDTESSGGLISGLFLSCNGLTGVLSL